MSTYTGSYSGIGAMLRSEMMVSAMAARGERVLARAIGTAPVYKGPDDRHRGRYKASFSMSTTSHGGSRGNRAAAVIRNSDPTAQYVEFGTSEEHGHYTLRNALSAASR